MSEEESKERCLYGEKVKLGKLKPFHSGAPVKDKLKWDFDRFVFQVDKLFTEGLTSCDLKSKLPWPQKVTIDGGSSGPEREIGVIFKEIECIADPKKPDNVGKVIVRGCMLRSDADKPELAPDCSAASSRAGETSGEGSIPGTENDNWYYSSSSSSSSWGGW